jgi:hypothetical protein
MHSMTCRDVLLSLPALALARRALGQAARPQIRVNGINRDALGI